MFGLHYKYVYSFSIGYLYMDMNGYQMDCNMPFGKLKLAYGNGNFIQLFCP